MVIKLKSLKHYLDNLSVLMNYGKQKHECYIKK